MRIIADIKNKHTQLYMAGTVRFCEDQHYKNSIKKFQPLYFSYDIFKREKNVVLGNIFFEMITLCCDHLPELLKIYIYKIDDGCQQTLCQFIFRILMHNISSRNHSSEIFITGFYYELSTMKINSLLNMIQEFIICINLFTITYY